ncbi:MAG: hypothetical protein OQK98_03185 [Gammaproteobacteria bacterium]|nr:hypothetical protein [Gammaproteobacteria bacterium]
MKTVYKKRLLLLSLMCVVLLFSARINAANMGFMKYAVITDFTQADIELLQKEYQKVLSNNKPGDTHNWSNKETNNGGQITVIKQYKNNKHPCKRLKFKNHSRQQSGVTYFNFCLTESQWKIVN